MKGDTLVIGREPGCELMLDDPGVSKKHAQIIRVENEYIIRDQGSVNGTFVGEHKITHHTLRDGDVIRIGKHELVFRLALGGAATGGSLAVVAGARADGGETGLAPVVEPVPFARQEWLDDRIAEIGAKEAADRRRVSWILNGAIVLGIVVTLIVLFAFRGPDTSAINLGTVTLEVGYPQIIYVPDMPERTSIQVIPQDLLQVQANDGDPVVAKLRVTDPNFPFAKVSPSNVGTGMIIIQAQREYVINVIVNPKQKAGDNDYAGEYAAARSPETPAKTKQDRADQLAKEARNIMYYQPYAGLQKVDLAKAYADPELTETLHLDTLHDDISKELDKQWDGLRLEYNQAVKRNDYDARARILEQMTKLIPNRRDLRHQWAQVNLDRTKFYLAKTRRPSGLWGG